MEIMVVSDVADARDLLQFDENQIPIQCVRNDNLDGDHFYRAILSNANGHWIHCPDLNAPLPPDWYVKALKQVLNHHKDPAFVDAGMPSSKYHFLPPGIALGSRVLQSIDHLKSGQKKTILSVIIPTYNRCAQLGQCLDALAKQAFATEDFEVIVCDDGSTDDTESLVKNYEAPFRLIYLKQTNKGPATARNMGIQRSSGAYLLFLNDDAIAAPDLLMRHYERLCLNKNEKIAVLGRFTLLPDYTKSLFGFALENSDLLFEYNKMQPEQLHDYRFFYTGNISISRAAVLKAGMFDESFCGPAAEDIELGYRLQKKGYKVFYEPKCIAWHNHELSIENFCKTHLTRGYGAITLYVKHPELCKFKGAGGHLIQQWKKEVENFSSKINDVIQIFESLNQAKTGNGKSSFTSADVNKIYPSLKFLFQYYMQKGYLSNPEINKLMLKQIQPWDNDQNMGGIEATPL
jgi:GT2 family glycosyltransferase